MSIQYTTFTPYIKVANDPNDADKLIVVTNTFKLTGVPKDKLDWITMPYAGVGGKIDLRCEDPDIALELCKRLQEQTNLNVFLHDNHPITRNYFKNAAELGRYGVKSIRSLDWSCDRPILFCGAGKSLVDQLDAVRNAIDTNSHLVIAGGSANRILAKHKIYPHFALCFDPNPCEHRYVFKFLDPEYIQRVPLIATTGLDHTCFMQYLNNKGIIYCSPSISLKKLSNHLFPKEPTLREGCSSVSTMITHVADRLFADDKRELYFIGVDLRFSDQGEVYGDGFYGKYDDVIEYEGITTRDIWAKESDGIVQECMELGINAYCATEKSLLVDQGMPHKSIEVEQKHSDIVIECFPFTYNKGELTYKVGEIRHQAANYLVRETLLKDSEFYQMYFEQYDQLQTFRACRGIDKNQVLLKAVTKQLMEQIDYYLKTL